jgi:hypothetical protein
MRIREDDVETKWWYPCQTSGGAIGDDRLVFPIPPDKHWRDEMPVILPKPAQNAITDQRAATTRAPKNSPHANGPVLHGARQFRPPTTTANAVVVQATPEPVVDNPKREKTPKVKCDPRHVALARELRDRWSEHVNTGAMQIEGAAKYDVTRMLPANVATPPTRLLAA